MNARMFQLLKTIVASLVLGCGIQASDALGAEIERPRPQDRDLVVRFTIAVPKVRFPLLIAAITEDTRYDPSKCFEVTLPQDPDFIDHLRPFPGVGREHYATALYKCQPALQQFYDLFNEKVSEHAVSHALYAHRLLVDTELAPHGNCPRQYCEADGLFHHSVSEPCGYC